MCNNCEYHDCVKRTQLINNELITREYHACSHDDYPWKFSTYETEKRLFKECPIYTLQACFQLIERMYQRINSLELDVERLKKLEVKNVHR